MPTPYDALVATLARQPAVGGAALGALPYGAPIGASLMGGQLMAEGNPAMMEAVFGNMAPWVRAAQLVAPFLMEARRAQPTPMPAPAGAYKPGMNTAPQATPPPQRTPAPRGTPQPPGPSLGQRAAAAGSAIGTAANQYRQVMEQARALPMGVWQNVIAPTLRTAALPAGLVYGPKYALDPAFRADINERVGQGVVRPLANWYTGGNAPAPMAAGGPTPTPTPTMGPTPQNTPTSAQTRAPLVYQEDVAAMPDGAVFEVEGMGVVQRRGDALYPVTPTPGLMAGR